MTSTDHPEKVLTSKSYQAAQSKAAEYAKDAIKLKKLVDQARRKASSENSGRFAEVRDSLGTMFRLLRAYAKGDYREIPWKSLTMIIASVSYFVMPIDLIPDFLVAFGLLDDVALITWTVSAIKSDLEAFIHWEKDQPIATDDWSGS